MASSDAATDFGTVYYRSKDSIKNLRIRVRLEKLTSSSLVPQAIIEKQIGSTSGGTEMREIQRKQDLMSQREEEVCVFSWQQKLFSQREFDQYKHEANCEGIIEKKYHEEVVQMSERPNRRLFSYVNHDPFTNQKENIQMMTTSPSEKPTPLAEKVANVRKRRGGGSSRLLEGSNTLITPKVNIVDQKPSFESQRRNHVIVTPEQVMVIMADLSHRDNKEPTESEEYVLCTIKVDANGVITMKPNFNHNKRPYRIETESLGKEVFTYTLENISTQMSNLEKKREEKMYKELYSRHAQYLSSIVGSEFELPPPNVLSMMLYGEIVSAWNFEYDNLFIRYIINVPSKLDGWKAVNQENVLSGVTATCMTKVEERENVAYFSFPFEAEMQYKPPVVSEDEGDMIMKSWPKIFFEVCSLDEWNRFRPEGYCAVVVPSVPGDHTFELNCWRPIGSSVVTNLRRFFVGGTPELEDLSYTHIPSDFKGSRMSRFGFKTQSTGIVKVKLNVLLQSQTFCFSASKAKERKKDLLMTQLGSAVDYTQIRTIIDAFSKAHDRMKTARENVFRNFQELSLDGKTMDAADHLIE